VLEYFFVGGDAAKYLFARLFVILLIVLVWGVIGMDCWEYVFFF